MKPCQGGYCRLMGERFRFLEESKEVQKPLGQLKWIGVFVPHLRALRGGGCNIAGTLASVLERPFFLEHVELVLFLRSFFTILKH